jgi:cobyrinic acid a,c-diamide synthase
MFHRRAVGVPSHNLDPFFSDRTQMNNQLAAKSGDLCLLEGAMGYYDGAGPDGLYSSYDVARETSTPVTLVIDAKGLYASAGAILKGFLEYRDDSGIRGVIFNNASPALYEGLSVIAERLGVKPLGFLPREPKAAVESRHLGLMTAGEISDVEEKLTRLGDLAERYIDINGLLELATAAPAIYTSNRARPEMKDYSVRIGVARDEAFCFFYEENMEMLTELGCNMEFFSPLNDNRLPGDISGLYLCGGYPELYAQALSANDAMLNAVNAAIRGKMPAIAECGGFLYLHDTLDGSPMTGVIHADAYRTDKLVRFGYITLRAGVDNLLCPAGRSIRAHEFHYYDSTDSGSGFIAQKPVSNRQWPCVHATRTLYAGFPHLYFNANPAFCENFIRKAVEYESGKYT